MNIRDTSMPRASQAFLEFAHVLRQHGFAVSPEQTVGFIEAIGLLGPRHVGDIRNAGIAMLAIPQTRWSEYDALFRAFFLGQTVSAPTSGEDEDGVEAFEPSGGEQEVELETDESEVGTEATRSESLSQRQFSALSETDLLQRFARTAPAALPRRRSARRRPQRHGERFDLRRSLREAVRRDGEVIALATTKRKTRQRPIVLMVDVSGSMKEQSETTMRLAHALVQAADRVEVMTLGTRLTRVTPALRDRNRDRALERVSELVADFDGGTLIGDALAALLAVPRFAGALRGAAVVVLSDGLERGDPNVMVECVARISRMAWRLDWLSPLAADPAYEPRTEALSAARPYLDALTDGSELEPIVDHILQLASVPSRSRAA